MNDQQELNSEIARILSFVVETDKLKEVLRKTCSTGSIRKENSAEHSWQVSLLALMLYPYAACDVDLSRAVKLLIIYDIPEINCGDTIVYDRQDDTFQKELTSAESVFDFLLRGGENEEICSLDRY